MFAHAHNYAFNIKVMTKLTCIFFLHICKQVGDERSVQVDGDRVLSLKTLNLKPLVFGKFVFYAES